MTTLVFIEEQGDFYIQGLFEDYYCASSLESCTRIFHEDLKRIEERCEQWIMLLEQDEIEVLESILKFFKEIGEDIVDNDVYDVIICLNNLRVKLKAITRDLENGSFTYKQTIIEE